MTTIIYHSGRVYADTRATITYEKSKKEVYYRVKKIFKTNNVLVSGSGKYFLILKMRYHWRRVILNIFGFYPSLYNYDESDSSNDITSLIVASGDMVQLMRIVPKKVTKWLIIIKLVDSSFYRNEDNLWVTTGSGNKYAASMLRRGRSPEKAIRLASKYDKWTNDDITWSNVPPSSLWTKLCFWLNKTYYSITTKNVK